MSRHAVEVRDLHKSYGDLVALDGVSFEVATGEVLALLGPNGAGKTTTVEILEGYRARSGGEVAVLGMDPARGGAELRRRIGIVLQSCGIDRYLSVREVLTMHAEYYPRPRPVEEVLDLVGLGEKAGQRVRALSGGQQRRLDVALGLIGDPEVLFLDEPTTGFDPAARRQAWDIVASLARLGKTVLLTTHYLEEAQALADRIVIIDRGRVVAEGTPAAIGGRARSTSRVRFTLGADVDAAELPVAAVPEPQRRWSFESADPTRDLHGLTSWALERGMRLEELTVAPPSLEETYLRLVDAADRGAVGEPSIDRGAVGEPSIDRGAVGEPEAQPGLGAHHGAGEVRR